VYSCGSRQDAKTEKRDASLVYEAPLSAQSEGTGPSEIVDWRAKGQHVDRDQRKRKFQRKFTLRSHVQGSWGEERRQGKPMNLLSGSVLGPG